MVYFFFSSRRRHTRFDCDWSSDVCSSDLVYLCMEGPQFSTRAESHLYRSWNVDVIGMTNLQEAKLAREAELCYATMALVTDYDCWRESSEDVNIEDILAHLRANAAMAQKILRGSIARTAAG